MLILLSDVLKPITTHRHHPARRRVHYKGRRQIRRRSHLLSRYLKPSLTALIAFIVAATVLGQLIPSPTIPSNVVFIGPKHDYYQAHKDDYNTLFFGSSRVYNQIDPNVFDTASQQAGIATNSYNFGIPAMRALDSTVLLEDVLSDPPKDLKWVFFETTLDKGYEPIQNARTHRSMYWHTWENTGFAARYILNSEVSAPSKAALLVSHLLPTVYRQMNVGRLFSQVLPSEFSPQERAAAEVFTRNEGYFPLVDESSPNRQHFLQHQADYIAAVNKLAATATEVSRPQLAENKRLLLAKVTQIIRAAGAEPIFIEPPALSPERDFRVAEQQGDIETLLAYKDPNRFPQLYEPQQRFDREHLTEQASQEFSRLLAKDFAQAARRAGRPEI